MKLPTPHVEYTELQFKDAPIYPLSSLSHSLKTSSTTPSITTEKSKKIGIKKIGSKKIGSKKIGKRKIIKTAKKN